MQVHGGDPIGLDGGSYSTYAYAGDNPIMYIDAAGLCWQFSQSTGRWSHVNDLTGLAVPVGNGFSGQGAGYNNPLMEYKENVGPLPTGLHLIGPGYTWHKMANVMDLTPILAYQFNRPGGFKIHGARTNPATRAQSSTGCPIAAPNLRALINSSDDRCLRVVP